MRRTLVTLAFAASVMATACTDEPVALPPAEVVVRDAYIGSLAVDGNALYWSSLTFVGGQRRGRVMRRDRDGTVTTVVQDDCLAQGLVRGARALFFFERCGIDWNPPYALARWDDTGKVEGLAMPDHGSGWPVDAVDGTVYLFGDNPDHDALRVIALDVTRRDTTVRTELPIGFGEPTVGAGELFAVVRFPGGALIGRVQERTGRVDYYPSIVANPGILAVAGPDLYWGDGATLWRTRIDHHGDAAPVATIAERWPLRAPVIVGDAMWLIEDQGDDPEAPRETLVRIDLTAGTTARFPMDGWLESLTADGDALLIVVLAGPPAAPPPPGWILRQPLR